MYGSNLWQLDSGMAGQYFSCWKTCVKLSWQVPMSTHTFFVDHLLSSGLTSVRNDVMARFNKFLKALRNSPSMEVAVMCGVAAGDVQTTTGSNRNLLEKETGLNMTTVGAPKV